MCVVYLVSYFMSSFNLGTSYYINLHANETVNKYPWHVIVWGGEVKIRTISSYFERLFLSKMKKVLIKALKWSELLYSSLQNLLKIFLQYAFWVNAYYKYLYRDEK
jgi:hypothetical protein